MSLCTNDYSFGPGADCRVLDFTVYFENIFLVFVPALSFLLVAVPRIPHLWKKQRRILPWKEIPIEGWALILQKAVFGGLLIAGNIGFWISVQKSGISDWSGWASTVCETITAVVISIFVLMEHLKNRRSSQLPQLYLVVKILFTATRIRTFYLISSGSSSSISSSLIVILSAEFCLFLILQIPYKSSLVDSNPPPGSTSGIISRYFVAWVLPLLFRGYIRPLTSKDLGEIDPTLHTLYTWDQFSFYWNSSRRRYIDGKTKQPLIWALIRAFPGRLASPLFPLLIYTFSSLGRPLLISATVNFVESYQTPEPQPISDGYGLIAGAFLVYLVFALSTAVSHIAIQRSSLSVRGALMEALYRKSLLIKVETASEMGAAKASNLISVDVNNIVRTMRAVHDSWTALILTGLGMWIIYGQIGISFLATVIGAIAFFAVLPICTKDISPSRTAWANATDVRVKFMSSVLRHIKALKLSAYEPRIFSIAQRMRVDEVKCLVTWIIQVLKVSILTNYLGNFLSIATITTYCLVSLYTSHDNGGINTAKIFTVVSTIELISEPLLMLGQQLGALITAWASLKRIEEFLLTDEKVLRDGFDEAEEEVEQEEGIKIIDGKDDTKGKLSEDRHVYRNVRMENATWGIEGKAKLLEGITINLNEPSLWMITGRVGCGKSSLLQALLTEIDLLSGTAKMDLGTIGFASQDAWLRVNSSIRENIVFMHPYKKKWYDKVISATALEVDFASLQDGDETLISNLSGGQKQRVALARAVYGKFDTLILDDPFSALDADTEARVFSALFGPDGLLKNTTVIVATNQIYRLPHASYITLLSEGVIAEQGTYAQLRKRRGLMTQLIAEFAAGAENKANAQPIDSDDIEIVPASVHTPSVKDKQSFMDKISFKDPQELEVTPPRPEEAEGQTGKVKWSTYLLYIKGMGYIQSFFWIMFVVVACMINLSTQLYLQAWTSTLAGSSPQRYGAFLGGYAGMQIGYFFAFCVGMLNAFAYLQPKASRNLHDWMCQGVLKAPIEFFESKPIGQIVNRFNSDLNMIDMQLPNHFCNFVFSSTVLIGSAIIMTVAGPYMAAVIAGTMLISVLIQRFYVRAGRELRRMDMTTRSPIFQLFSETIDPDGLRTIRAMKAENMLRQAFTERATTSQYPAWLLAVVQKWLELALNILVLVVNTLLVTVAIINRNSTSSGILAVAMVQGANMSISIMFTVVEWTNVEMCVTSVERIQEYVELPAQNDSGDPNFLKRVSGSTTDSSKLWLRKGGIRFSNISARYAEHLPQALKNVDFVIKPGSRVGICGRSGSGKSTLLGVLWRLIECEEGEIMVDGFDISDIPLGAYRDAMSIIPQDPLLLELSLRENVDIEGKHTDDEIWDALDRAQLKTHCETLSSKLDTMMTPTSLSRGQRQLLALSRAILRARPILALDEATSSIDAQTDAAIQQTIRDSFENTTILTIAHRIGTIVDYDVIVVMDQGSVIEMGSPDVLLRREFGKFRALAMESGIVVDGVDAVGETSGTRMEE